MNDTPMIAPMFPENEPTAHSSLEELAAYALNKQRQIIARDKKNGEDLWLMGQALEWAFQKTKHGEWEDWFKAEGLKKTYVWQARKLHEVATLDEVKKLGMTEALRKFEVVAEKKPHSSTKTAGGKSKKAVSACEKEAEEEAAAPESNQAAEPKEDDNDDQDQGDEQPTGDLADEEEKEFKEFEASIRKLTPKARAVVIHHALEFLRDDLDSQEVDQELQETLGQIAQLAQELKGQSLDVEAA